MELDRQLILTIITGISIGATSGCLGTLMLTRRMALVAGPLGHLTLPGVALAILYDFNVSLGAFPFVIFGVVVIWQLEIRSGLPVEALTALVFATGVAAAFLFLPVKQAEVALVGDVSRVSLYEVLGSIILSFMLLIVIRRIFKPLILTTIAEDLARVEGIDVRRYNLIYLILVAVTVSMGVKMVGGLLTAALVAIPAAAARNVSRNVHQYARVATVIGAASALLGILLSRVLSFPAGPLIVLTNSLIFFFTLFIKKR